MRRFRELAEGSTLLREHYPLLAALVGPTALFGPTLLRGEALFWGAPLLQFTPWHSYAAQVIRSGHVPLWNPLVGMGAPLLANYQSALLYPPNLLLNFIDVAWGQTALVMLHLMWAGLGMATLARALRFNRLGQMLAGLAFSLSGYLLSRSGFLSINATVAWLPWIILGVERLLTHWHWTFRKAAGPVSLLALAFGFQWLAGHAQISWYTLLLALAWAVWRGRDRARMPQFAVGMSASLLLGFGLAAAQLLPTLEYTALSGRAGGLDRHFALNYSLWPWRLLGLLAPNLFGSPARGDFWGYGNFWEDALYIGALPLLLAMHHLIRGRSRMRAPLAVLLLLSFAFALGRNTPIFPYLFDNVPSFDLFQGPTRWSLLGIFSLSLLAGLAAGSWSLPSGRGLYWLRLGTAGAGAITLFALLFGAFIPDLNPTFVPAIARMGAILMVAGILSLLRLRMLEHHWQLAVTLFVLGDLMIAGTALNPTRPRSLQAYRPTAETRGRYYMPSDLEQELKFERAFRFDSFNDAFEWELVREWRLPNVAMLEGVPAANNFDPLVSARFDRWMQELESPEAGPLLSHMGLDSITTRYGEGEIGPKHLGRSERIRLVDRAAPVSDPNAVLRALRDAPSDLVLIEADELPPREGSGPPGSWDLLEGNNPNVVEISVETPVARWLVLSDQWYPGWQATIDGEPTTNYRANYLFRAVWVPAGEHLIRFQYAPWTFGLGVALSAMGAVLLAGALVLWTRTR